MLQRIAFAVCALVLAAGAVQAQSGQGGASRVSAALEPEQEVPAVSSLARGEFKAVIDEERGTIDYELTFSDLQADSRQSHIHIGQPSVNGGIVVWLCQTTFNVAPPATSADTPTCPTRAGTVTGTIRPENIITVATQGFATGEFSELVAALRKGIAYVNVHTAQSPGGEIRGLVQVGAGHQ